MTTSPPAAPVCPILTGLTVTSLSLLRIKRAKKGGERTNEGDKGRTDADADRGRREERPESEEASQKIGFQGLTMNMPDNEISLRDCVCKQAATSSTWDNCNVKIELLSRKRAFYAG